MNKRLFLLLALALALAGCGAPAPAAVERTAVSPSLAQAVGTPTPTGPATVPATPLALTTTPRTIEDVIAAEMQGSFAFFWKQANTRPGSAGFGLIRDRYPGSGADAANVASMAAVGFGLTAYLIGIDQGMISYDEGLARVDGTLDTLLQMERKEGFFYHFVTLETGQRAWNSEVSSIDTAILMMGVLAVGQYFGGDIQAKATQLYGEVNWPWFVDPDRDMFYMAYRPEKGFEGHWDFYAEQLMLYVLAAGSDTFPTSATPYYTFTRHLARYGEGQPFIHSWFGSLFTYQYSHAWLDFRNLVDREQVNWFANSVAATQAHVDFATNMDAKYATIGPDAWGLTACDGPDGYNGLYGAPPSGYDNRAHVVDDTVSPAGAIGSIIFLPQDAQRAMLHYAGVAGLTGRYGFFDAYNLSEEWTAADVIGIDKGITLLMLANYENDFVYRVMMPNKHIQQGLERLQFTPVSEASATP